MPTSAVVAPEEEEDPTAAPAKTFDFDDEFQLKLVALLFRDSEFNAKVEGLVDPSYFVNAVDGIICRIGAEYFAKYRFCPSRGLVSTLIRDGITKKLIRKDDMMDLVARINEVFADDLSDAEYISEQVDAFAKRCALEAAIYKCADMCDKGKFDGVQALINEALNVGVNEESNRYDYWGNNEGRAHYRGEVLAGRIKPSGITTGHKDFDDLLFHKGWGRKELSVLMGPAKSGKSMALIGFGLAASTSGLNVAYVTLEVAARIVADRSDANLGNQNINDLNNAIGIVKGRVLVKQATSGALDIYDYPSGSFSPSDLRRLIAKKRSQGVKYDLVIVDYADLMRPDNLSQETRENSRTIYVGLRGVAQEFDCAVLSATQTNREGFKAASGRMEHVSEDINKARTVDLLISLNATEEEKMRGEARLFIAASRNQKSEITIRVKAELAKAKYIQQIVSIE